MDEETRNLDLMVGELESENKQMRMHIEQLLQELERLVNENARFKVALARIMAVSKLYLEQGKPEGVNQTKENV